MLVDARHFIDAQIILPTARNGAKKCRYQRIVCERSISRQKNSILNRKLADQKNGRLFIAYLILSCYNQRGRKNHACERALFFYQDINAL